MKRRDFIKTTGIGLAAMVVGSKIPGISDNRQSLQPKLWIFPSLTPSRRCRPSTRGLPDAPWWGPQPGHLLLLDL